MCSLGLGVTSTSMATAREIVRIQFLVSLLRLLSGCVGLRVPGRFANVADYGFNDKISSYLCYK